MRRYHVTTFGCQMNAHDSERIKGMLESLGLGEAATPEDADVVVFNTCTIREKPDTRLAAYLGQRRRDEARAARPRHRGRRLLRRGAARTDLRALSVRRRRFRAGLDPASRRLDHRRAATPSSVGDSAPTSTSPPTFRSTASAASRRGCRSRWDATRRARTASSPLFAAGSRAGGRARSSPRCTQLARCRRPRDHAARPERQLLGPRPSARDPHRVRRAAARMRRGDRASSGSASRARTPRTSARRSSRRSPSAQASASTFTCQRSPARRASSRRCAARTTAIATSRLVDTLRDAIPDLALGTDLIVGIPRRDRARLRGDAVARRRGSVRQRIHVHLLAARGDGGGAPCRTRFRTTSSTRRLEALVERVQRIAAERNAERVGRVEEVLVEGPSRTDPALVRGRTRRNTTVNFDGRRVRRRPRRRAGRGRHLDDPSRPHGVARRGLRGASTFAHSRHDS